MRKYAPGDIGSWLDVCYLQSEVSLCERKRIIYYMGLLSHAAICRQKDMVELLLQKGASKDILMHASETSGIELFHHYDVIE